eukprot:jgi/Ulvmu1/11928/UM082_0006.1
MGSEFSRSCCNWNLCAVIMATQQVHPNATYLVRLAIVIAAACYCRFAELEYNIERTINTIKVDTGVEACCCECASGDSGSCVLRLAQGPVLCVGYSHSGSQVA